MTHLHNMRLALVGVAAAFAVAAPAAHASTDTLSGPVCNQSENSHRGDLRIGGRYLEQTGSADRNTSGLMRVGNDRASAGLIRAAYRSQALAVCGVDDAPPPPPPGGGTGGGDVIVG